MSNTPKDVLGMSDEDFLNMNPASATETAPEETQEPAPVVEAIVEPAKPDTNSDDDNDGNPAPTDDKSGKPEDIKPKEPTPSGSEPKAGDPPKDDKGAPTEPKGGEKPTDKKEAPAPVVSTPEDHKTFYETLIGKPIKANGKEVTLKNPDEVVRLVQMGMGYMKKIQDMQPHVKTLRMLEKNNLLDENKLSHLIDLDQGNVEAIKKLIKDKGLDPLDFNMGDNADYRPTNHAVSDAEVKFRDALTELQSHPQGKTTIAEINSTWDQTSKEILWESPELLSVIQEQKDNGIYKTIITELERQKLLGLIPPNTPFIHAYKIAGDTIYKPGNDGQEPNGSGTPVQEVAPSGQPKVLDTRVVTPKPNATNGDKARAASPTQSTPRKASESVNPLNMADDDFLKQFSSRL